MKKVFTTVILGVMLLSCFGCTSENESVDKLEQLVAINKIFEFSDDYTTTTISKSSTLAGNYSSNQNCLLFTTKTVDSKVRCFVYNLLTETEIGNYPNEDMVTISSGYYIYFVEENEKYSMYNVQGTKIDEFELTETITPNYVAEDVFTVADIYYVVNDTVVTRLGDTYNVVPTPNYENEKYQYFIDTDDYVLISENDKAPVYFMVPSFAEDGYIGILENGNVLIQYIYLVTEKDDYDYWDTYYEQYYKFATYTLTPKGKLSEIDFPYIVGEIFNEISEPEMWKMYNCKVDNLISCTEIVNKQQDGGFVAICSNNLEIGQAVYTGYTNISIVNSNRTIVSIADNDYLYDAKGKLMGQFNDLNRWTTKYLIDNNEIFDCDLKKLTSFGEYDYYGRVGENFVFTKDTDDGQEAYIFNGTFNKVAEGVLTISTYSTYNIVGISTADGFDYFNEKAEKILTTKSGLYFFSSNNGVVFAYSVAEDNSHEYYKLSYSNPVISYFNT